MWGQLIVQTKTFPDMLKSLRQQQEKVKHALEIVSKSLTGERLRVALETMRALHVYESAGVEAVARIRQINCKQLEQTSLAYKRKMDQGKGAVSKLRAETVMSVVVTGTRSGCENKSCGDDGSMFLEQSPVANRPLSPQSDPTSFHRKNQKLPAACTTKRQVPYHPPHRNRIGLPNLGDTSYGNSAIQCLAHCTSLNPGLHARMPADATTHGTCTMAASERVGYITRR